MTKETYFEELDLTIVDKVRDVLGEQLIERLQQMPVVDVAGYLKHLPIEGFWRCFCYSPLMSRG